MSINKVGLEERLYDLVSLSWIDATEFHQARMEASIHEVLWFLWSKQRENTQFYPEYLAEWRDILERIAQNRHIGILKFLATHDTSLLHRYNNEDIIILERIAAISPIWFQIYAWIVTAEYYQKQIPETTNLSPEDNKKTLDYFNGVYTPSLQLWNKEREKHDLPTTEIRINESESVRILENTLQLIRSYIASPRDDSLDISIAALWWKCYALLHVLWIPKESLEKHHTHVENIEQIFEYIAGILDQKSNHKNTVPHPAIYAIIKETAELLEDHNFYMKRWQRYNKFQKYWEIDPESKSAINKIWRNTAKTSDYLRYYEQSAHEILNQKENPIIESLKMVSGHNIEEQNDWLLLLQSEPDILKYIATGEPSSLKEEHFYVEEFCNTEELPIHMRDKAAMLLYRIIKTFSWILPEWHFWWNEDDERNARTYYRKNYLPYISYREQCGDSLPAFAGGILQSELTRIFVHRLQAHRHSNAHQSYTNSAFLTLIQMLYQLSELGIDVDYDFWKIKIDAPSFSFFIKRMLANPIIRSSLESLTLEDGSDWYLQAEYIAITLENDEKEVHHETVNDTTKARIKKMQENSKSWSSFHLKEWIEWLKKEG